MSQSQSKMCPAQSTSPAQTQSTPEQAAAGVGVAANGAGQGNQAAQAQLQSKGPDGGAVGQGQDVTGPDPESVAARAELDQFMGSVFSQDNWVTGNGYGAFDLIYIPGVSMCMINVDICFNFVNAPASVIMKYLGTGDVSNLVECVWTDDQKKKFKEDMIAQVSRVWSGKHTLNCQYDNPKLDDGQSPTWKDVKAEVACNVNPVESGGHFKVDVVALPKADNLRSFVAGTDHDKTQGTNRATPATRTAGGTVSDANFQTTGGSFNKHDNEVEEKASSFDGTTVTVKKGDTLSKIAKEQYGDASKWTLIYNANKGVVGADPNRILPGQVLTLKVPKTRQATSAHEFGHMLGLDDQYVGGGGGAGTPGAVNDDGSKTSAVPADEHRIMDGGEVVLTEHYSTIVEALNAATTPVNFAA